MQSCQGFRQENAAYLHNSEVRTQNAIETALLTKIWDCHGSSVHRGIPAGIPSGRKREAELQFQGPPLLSDCLQVPHVTLPKGSPLIPASVAHCVHFVKGPFRSKGIAMTLLLSSPFRSSPLASGLRCTCPRHGRMVTDATPNHPVLLTHPVTV